MKSDVVYLKHIIDAINQMQGYVRGMSLEAFRANRLVQDGVIRQFEIITASDLAYRRVAVDVETGKVKGVF